MKFSVNGYQKFKYILLDFQANEIEFSGRGSFDPNDVDSWQVFPMTIETSKRNQNILAVTIPFNGKSRKVRFDTGAAPGLTIPPTEWKEISPSVAFSGPKKMRIKKVDGLVRSKYYIARELQIAGKTIKNAEVTIGPFSDPDLDNEMILLGIGFFKGDVMVLDFENELLRVKTGGSGLIN